MAAKIDSTQLLPSLLARTMSSEEVTLNFFYIQNTSAEQKTCKETLITNNKRRWVKSSVAENR